jgi:hypothetical protein
MDEPAGPAIRVPRSQIAQARELLEAFNWGEFALGDDFDAGSAGGCGGG